MTKKIIIAITIINISLLHLVADGVKVEHTKMMSLGDMVSTNAKITQLSNQKQEIVSILGGHIEKYFVKQGEEIKDGDKIVLMKSMKLSQMTAEYLALSKQIKASKTDLNTAQELYRKGVGSREEKNSKIISLQDIKSKRNSLKSQLEALGISTKELNSTTDELILYAHADGVVSELLTPLHSTVDAQTPLVRIAKESGYYALAYLTIDRAMRVTQDTQGWIEVAKKRYRCSFVQLLPDIDEETQQAQVLFWIEGDPKRLLLGAYLQIDISLPPYEKRVTVKSSALSMMQGEWVIFLSREEGDEKEHDDHKEHGDDEKHKEHDEHKDEAKDQEEHDEHGDHDKHEESLYTPQVVEIITRSGDLVAIRGVDAGVEYVSEGVYIVKSKMLKSSLGGHGH